MEQPTIKMICAWCTKVLREGTVPASHGICPSCQKAVFKEQDEEPDNQQGELIQWRHDPRR